MHFKDKIAPLALCVALCACAHTKNEVAISAHMNWTGESGKRVVLVDPDIELSELTFGGVAEPRADWTSAAKNFITADIAAALKTKGITTVSADNISDRHEAQLVKLHDALGLSIQMNQLQAWPTKKNNFDWTLGPGAAVLRQHYKADYALFTFVRDSYSSDSRKALSVLLMRPTGAVQQGFASLVDLRTGRIVWFNRLADQYGGLRDEKSAGESVEHLLDGLPL
jgi:hypothetical protein